LLPPRGWRGDASIIVERPARARKKVEVSILKEGLIG
jgi:hypothetical protein